MRSGLRVGLAAGKALWMDVARLWEEGRAQWEEQVACHTDQILIKIHLMAALQHTKLHALMLSLVAEGELISLLRLMVLKW